MPEKRKQDQFASFVKLTDKSKVAVQKALDEAQLLFDSLMQEYLDDGKENYGRNRNKAYSNRGNM